MALGFTTSSAYGNLTVVPDRGLTRNAKQNTLVVNFGDGYEQRISRGLNNTMETYNITLTNRPRVEAENIVGYLNSLNGVTSFNFTLPDFAGTEETTGVLDSAVDDERTIKVVCEEVNQNYVRDSNYTITAKLRRVYEP
jgi:phage-related protein